MISRFTADHINHALALAKICNLSAWSFADYLEEINRIETVGFVSIESEAVPERPINGFIISRLIILTKLPSLTPDQKAIEVKDNNAENPTGNVIENIENPVNSVECEILNIGVDPRTQRNGIGQKLLDATILECDRYNAASVWLDVREGNDNAFRFYRRNNFEVVYTRKNYYQNPIENALVMRAYLRKPF